MDLKYSKEIWNSTFLFVMATVSGNHVVPIEPVEEDEYADLRKNTMLTF